MIRPMFVQPCEVLDHAKGTARVMRQPQARPAQPGAVRSRRPRQLCSQAICVPTPHSHPGFGELQHAAGCVGPVVGCHLGAELPACMRQGSGIQLRHTGQLAATGRGWGQSQSRIGLPHQFPLMKRRVTRQLTRSWRRASLLLTLATARHTRNGGCVPFRPKIERAWS